jgi:hypothetical protein
VSLDKLQQEFHDLSVHLNAQAIAGKTILHIRTAADICEGIELLIKEIKKLNVS